MTITVEIPDQLGAALVALGIDPSRAVLEAVALEGYRRDLLTESAVRRLLGFETRMEVHGFLKNHCAFAQYTLEDLEHDTVVAIQVAQKIGNQLEKSKRGQRDDHRC